MSKNKNKRNVKINRNVLIDVVIPNRGKFDFLEKCLNKLPEAMGELSYNVWICDNGSKPEEVVFYDKYKTSSQIHATIYHNGLGYPKACNVAAKQGSAPLILILTNDVFLEPHSVEHLVRELDEPKNGVAGMKLLFPEGTPHGPPNKVQHVGIELNIKADFYHQFVGWSPNNPKVLAKKEAFAVTGAVFLTRRSIWNRLKGFNEIYGLGTYEDVEYCVQTRKLGYNIVISQEAIGYHWVNATAADGGFAYPLNENKHIFMSRNSKDLIWQEYKWW